LIPGKDQFYGAVIVALLVGFGWYTHHERALGAAHEVAALKISSDKLEKAAAKQVTQTAADYAATLSTVKENLDAQLQTASTQHESDALRLRDYDTYRRQHPALGSAGAGPGAQPAGSTGPGADESRLASLEQMALELADGGRAVSAALTACVKDRDSLTGK